MALHPGIGFVNSNTATTDPIFDQNTGNYSGFNITIDPEKENHGANGWAIDAAHEGTNVSDFENYMLNPDTGVQHKVGGQAAVFC